MTTSSVPAVKERLVTVLRARLPDVQVEYRWPGDNQQDRSVWLGNVNGTDSYPVMRAGRKPREENYTLQVIAEAVVAEDWGPDSDVAVFDLMAALENALADDPQIGLGTSIPTLRLGLAGYELQAVPQQPGGWGSRLEMNVTVLSRLT